MKKTILKGVAVASVLTVGSGFKVKADETVNPKEETKEYVSVSEFKTVTEADVKAFEDKMIEATNAVNSQKEVVSKAEADKQTAEMLLFATQVGVDKAESFVKQATPETIEAIKDDITKTETDLSEADRVIVKAEEEVTKAETAVSNQETVVNTIKADLSAKEEVVAEAQSDVDKAQSILDGTNQADVVAEADQAKEALAIAKSELSKAEADLTKAKEVDKKREQDIAEWTSKVETAEADLVIKGGALSSASSKADETRIALKLAQNTLTEAENKVNAINTITFSDEYVRAFKDYTEHYLEKGDEAKTVLDSLAEEHRARNRFKANPSDEKVLLNTNDLSDEVLLELSNFASDLINQIRHTFGKPNTVVTPSSIRFASLVANGYVTDDWMWENVRTKGHDEKAIAKAASEVGLKDDRQYYENLNSYKMSHSQLSLLDAKARIYKSIADFMFNGWEYLHAESIAGYYNKGVTYLGVDFSSRSDTTGVHFLLVDDSHILDKTKFDTTGLDNSYNSQLLKKAHDVAQADFAKAREADSQAKTIKANAEIAHANSQAVLNRANQELSEIKAKEVLTPLANSKRDNAKVNLNKAFARNQNAQTALANLSAGVKTKQEALAKAKEILKIKTADKNNVSSVLATEQGKLNDLKTVVNDKKDFLSKSKATKTALQDNLTAQIAHLERLKNAPKLFESAKLDLAKAKERLDKAVAELNREVKILKDLEAKQTEVKEQYAKVIEVYQKVLEVRRQVELERQKSEIERQGKVAVPVFDDKGQLSAYVAETVADDKPYSSNVDTSVQGGEAKQLIDKSSQLTVAKESTSNNLPKANSKSSIWLSLMGLMAISSGLFVYKRQRK